MDKDSSALVAGTQAAATQAREAKVTGQTMAACSSIPQVRLVPSRKNRRSDVFFQFPFSRTRTMVPSPAPAQRPPTQDPKLKVPFM